ncbi:MAG TPA: hypothetical protein VKX17_01090 [Planctomycetota bacterium]|nr:hypothetical protein [Planctomycetota bacterium]
MRTIVLALFALLCSAPLSLRAETPAEFEARGVSALKQALTDPDQIVSAAISLGMAAQGYDDAKDAVKSAEMNALLFWCNKKMTLQQVDFLLRQGNEGAAAAKRFTKMMKGLPPGDAQTWFNRAAEFAAAHPDEHLLIAIRFCEIADRFKSTEFPVRAQERFVREIVVAEALAKGTLKSPPIEMKSGAFASSQKQPMPPEDKLNEARAAMKQQYAADFRTTKPAQRADFGHRLLKAGLETQDNPAMQFILLREAAEQCANGRETDNTMRALSELGARFNMDILSLKLDFLARLMAYAVEPEHHKPLAMLYQAVGNEALAEENYEVAQRAFEYGEASAQRAEDDRLAARMHAGIAALHEVQGELTKIKTAYSTLYNKPDDPEANLLLGRFLCASRGEWIPGLLFLAKGSDAALKAAALKDLAGPTEAAALADLADDWWNAAEKFAGSKKHKLRERAALLYEKALPDLADPQKEAVAKRVADFRAGK